MFWNVKDGPVVVDVPPSGSGVGLFGTLMDAWQRPLADVGAKGHDAGRGAKYLMLPPNYQDTYPRGYVCLKQKTYNGYTLMRPIIPDASKENLTKAVNFVKKLKVYPFSKADNPPETRHIDIYDKSIDGVAHFNESYYDRLDKMIQEENLEEKDLAFLGTLKMIGIEKGVKFAPSGKQKEILASAAKEAHEYMIENYLDRVAARWYKKGQWFSAVPVSGPPTNLEWDFPNYLDYDSRGTGYYAFYTS